MAAEEATVLTLETQEFIEKYGEWLETHGVPWPNYLKMRALRDEGNALIEGINRNFWEKPIYSWEVHYGRYGYQIGPKGSKRGLTEKQAARLRKIQWELKELEAGNHFDTETGELLIYCSLLGKCVRCCPELATRSISEAIKVFEN